MMSLEVDNIGPMLQKKIMNVMIFRDILASMIVHSLVYKAKESCNLGLRLKARTTQCPSPRAMRWKEFYLAQEGVRLFVLSRFSTN